MNIYDIFEIIAELFDYVIVIAYDNGNATYIDSKKVATSTWFQKIFLWEIAYSLTNSNSWPTPEYVTKEFK